jgi:hypothetical protein
MCMCIVDGCVSGCIWMCFFVDMDMVCVYLCGRARACAHMHARVSGGMAQGVSLFCAG